ncbi:ABC transporter substrate-binding protein [Halorhabdus amylolytica]|uniref:ABC transporter substrate-binding protein n=1 Tax=Halorhabdus amylolytica TaxID=2559573 RepID=UPI0010AA28DF|nr:ABC transporter substrate-binding protein [Halorhabdus amylolytica]
MGCTSGSDGRSTRREYLRYGATVIGGGLLAGCLGSEDDASSEMETDPVTVTGTATETARSTTDGTTTEGTADTPTDSSHSVSLVPVGEVTFEGIPETWLANNGSWADMGIALGQDPPDGVWLPSRYHTHYYDEIPDVSVETSEIERLSQDGVSKERFYAIDADVHVIDPNFITNRFEWSGDDVAQIEREVGPFFGNSIFSRNYSWHDDYRYYTLYEAFEKLATVFEQRERFEAFTSIHGDFQAELASMVPGQDERPAAAVLWAGGDQPEKFFPYIIDEGTSFKHLRDLGVRDALAATDVKDFHSSRGAIDYETLLNVDPEVILVRGQEAKSGAEFRDSVVSFMESHAVASQLTAVGNDDVYRAGPLYQGPITNFVVTERLARELYGVEEELFDRERVSTVVNGEF